MALAAIVGDWRTIALMFVGHFAVAFAARRVERQVSLAVLLGR